MDGRSEGNLRRRTYLYGSAGVAGVVGLGVTGVVGIGSRNSAADSDDTDPPVRRSLASLRQSDPHDIVETLRDGIEHLRDLDSGAARNYDNYVEIHGTETEFTNCRHGDWLFFAWHRAYLHYFEQIIRDVTGNDRFALPYWDWTERPELPKEFRGDDGTLGDPTRTTPSTLDRSLVDPDQIEEGLADPNFLRVVGGWADTVDSASNSDISLGAGALEAPSHDYVHIRVGGNMARGNSPADPCFWVHHSMVDRLWWEFNARGHPNPADDDWLDYDLGGVFVDPDGETVEDLRVEDTLEFPETEYTYDTRMATGGDPPETDDMTATASVDLDVLEEISLATDATLGVDSPIGGEFERDSVEPYLREDGPQGQLLLAARRVELPKAASFNAFAHVNRAARRQLPSSGRTYAGAFHFFRPPPGYRRRNYFVDISETLRELYADDRLEARVPVGVSGDGLRGRKDGDPDEPTVHVDELSVLVTQSVIDGETRERPR